MKKVINRKKYDTEKAEWIHGWSNGFDSSNFRFEYESLYRTAGGNLFLHVEGGGKTVHATQCGDGTGPGEDIVAVSREEAIDWLESHDGAEAIEKHFADAVEEA